MNTKNERTRSAQSRPALPPTRPRRFRIDKLEERIAPAKGGMTKGGGFSGGHDRKSCWCS